MKSFYRSVIDEAVGSIFLEKTIFVIPNRRSRLIVKNEILNTISKTSISPIILSIDDFIEKIADLKESTRTSQMFLLYESYIKASGLKELNSYSSFRSWSNTLLNDLNDIDMSLCDNTLIFKDLFEILGAVVQFEFNKSDLRDDAIELLLSVYNIMSKYGNTDFIIEGHTDSSGPKAFNKKLSLQRAERVKSHLVSKGVDGNRLSTAGFGEENPIQSNNTRKGRIANRRVEFKVVD